MKSNSFLVLLLRRNVGLTFVFSFSPPRLPTRTSANLCFCLSGQFSSSSYDQQATSGLGQERWSSSGTLNDNSERYWFSGWQVPKSLLQCISCVLGSEDYKRWMRGRATGGSCHVNSVSRIDKLSRTAFPFSFVLLNLLYWRFYFTERNAGFLSWEDGRPIS